MAESKQENATVGAVWEVKSTDPMTITRPDGSTSRVEPTADGVIQHVLDIPGTYHFGKDKVRAR